MYENIKHINSMHAYLVQSQNQEPYGSVNSKCTNNSTPPPPHPASTQAFVRHLPSCVLPPWGICYQKSAGVGEFLSVEFYIFLLIEQEVKMAKC